MARGDVSWIQQRINGNFLRSVLSNIRHVTAVLLWLWWRCPFTDLVTPLGFQGVKASKIYRQSAHEGCQPYAPTFCTPLPPQEIHETFIRERGWVDPRAMVQPERLSRWTIPMKPIGNRTCVCIYGCTLYIWLYIYCMCGCMFCMLLLNFVNYVFFLLCLCILIVMYVPF